MNIDRTVMIPLRDGTRVAATVYRPDTSHPVPATLIFVPYRKDDFNATFDEYPCEYFTDHGYASVMVDMRGCGASEGLRWESFDSEHEGQDGADVVEWIAAQSWCDSNVGMWGVSYPGSTSFRTAVQQPPHLKAIVPIMAITDARELWYPNGSLTPFLSTEWAGMMFPMELLPPGRQDAEGNWYRIWMNRLENFSERSTEWRAHPAADDDYWQDRLTDFAKIEAATFVIGGWRDIFPREMIWAFEQLNCPKKFMMGPWEHLHPHSSLENPVDHLLLIRQWFDRWLKGAPAPEDDPLITYYTFGAEEWRVGDTWPFRGETEVSLALTGGRLTDQDVPDALVDLTTSPTIGAQSILFDGFGSGIGHALEQGPDETQSLTFDLDTLDEEFEITGFPRVILSMAKASHHDFDLSAKLSHVGPDRISTQITLGSARVGSEQSTKETDATAESSQVEVELYPISYVVPAGHTLRLSLALSDFPRHWPPATTPQVRVLLGQNGSRLFLPTGAGIAYTTAILPVPDTTVNTEPLTIDGHRDRRVIRSAEMGTVTTEIDLSSVAHLPSGHGRLSQDHRYRFTVSDSPDAARAESELVVSLDLENGSRVEVHSNTWQTRVSQWGKATIYLDGKPFVERSFQAG
ncbi:CocE/NonD family hydrolase [Rhodococcoides yunnanense]|uniref:CocE/NonD family hydrolase n=1 Tax=Rhodococcoides yunnanense TaxID=278209 RepID=A0ABU4BIS0_9NOCA|nr:CocE/NonD family hydrolase [Rhodococcus yunnanensis]MDV6263981.1 CocE/NonD family hydrolase [Rhodococcus yunnanensis]